MLIMDYYSVQNLAAWALHPQQSQIAHPSHIQPGSEISSHSGNLAWVFSDHGLGFTLAFVRMC